MSELLFRSGGVEKLILKLTSASTGVEVEARAELGKKKYRETSHPLARVVALSRPFCMKKVNSKLSNFHSNKASLKHLSKIL